MTDGEVGGYRLSEQLGEGGMGTVYRARQIDLDREVALKVLRPGVMGAEETQLRFQREMLTQAQLAHPGLVRVLDGGTVDGTAYIAMELVRGKTLTELIVQAAPFGWPFALAVTCRIAEALAYLHGQDILHRDIKPSNILVSRDGEVKLADFGLARFTHSTLVTEDGAVVGTLQFMAPELLVGDPATPASELWSVGCVLFVMLTGRMHVEATGSTAFARAVVNDPIRSPAALASGLPPPVSQLVLALLDKDPATRLDSARELAERADELLEKGGHRADQILKAGVIDEIGVWRALAAEATEEERTITVPVSRGQPAERARAAAPAASEPAAPPAHGRLLPALAVLVVLALSLVLAFSPVRLRKVPPTPNPSPSASLAAPTTPSPAAPSPERSRTPRWHIPTSYFPRLKAGGPGATKAAAELSALSPVKLGDEPEVWLHAHRLAVWLSDRNRPPLPPHLTTGSERTISPLAASWVNLQIETADKEGPASLFSLAIRMVANYPDDPRAWFLLGRGLESSESVDEARVAYRKGLDLLGPSPLEDAGEETWQAFSRALVHHPPPDLERQWFRWLGAKKAKFYAWQAVRDATERTQPAVYERLLEAGAADPNSGEQAGYYLGLRLLEAHGSYPRALSAWKRALVCAPNSKLVASTIVGHAVKNNDRASAEEAARALPADHPAHRLLKVDK